MRGEASMPSVHLMVVFPPTPGSTLAMGQNQLWMPWPVLIASHTCSGEAAISICTSCLRIGSLVDSDGVGFDGFFASDHGIDAGEETESAARGSGFVVIFGGEAGDAVGEVLGERIAGLGGGEADVDLERECRDALAGFVGAATDDGEVADGARGEGDEVADG